MPIIAFNLTAIILLIISAMTTTPMLLGERLFGEFGKIQILFHAIYSYYLVSLFLKSNDRTKLRSKIWLFFTFVFFTQLLLGILGNTSFLQTGKLHYPIPALIVAGPIFRGEGFFMIGLLLSTIILVGPVWCSHLCYIGALDNYFANSKKRALKIRSKYLASIRWIVLFLTLNIPLLFNYFNSTMAVIHLVIITFIILSILSIILSKKFGLMFHCSYLCPIGIITTTLGRINPFKIRITTDCSRCGRCTHTCKYGALTKEDIFNNQAGGRCTLCLDCLSSCHQSSISLIFFNQEKNAKAIFYTLVISLHSIFLAVARI